jgi:hypothetical protein
VVGVRRQVCWQGGRREHFEMIGMSRTIVVAMAVLVAASWAGAAEPSSSPSPSFNNDLMAVLSKAGCNAGACHGNKSGKGGFKLSLRGQDPDGDYATLTRDLFARRTNPLDPEQSLILLKATTKLAHEGGVRFKADSEEYRILRDWIAAGTPRDAASAPGLVRLEVTPAEQVLVEPANSVRIRATAVFSDGSRRDVTGLAVYEQSATEMAAIAPDGVVKRQRNGETTVIVRYLQCQEPVRLTFVPARPDFVWQPVAARNYIDEAILAKLRTLRVNPSAVCGDLEFMRRAYLDLLGALPTVEEAKAFAADTSNEKRSKLIDALLRRPEYADFWALKWSDLLRNEERTIDRTGVQAFHEWIRASIASNKPLDQFARELLAGRGSTYTNPPANYYRANRDAVTRGEATAQLFLGVRLQCAQCHNHPFDRWTQDDYYSWADVFGRVDYKIIENRRTDKNDSHEFVGEQIVYEKPSGEIKDPRGGDKAVQPKLLSTSGAIADGQDRLDALAAWVTSPRNPYFAKAQVNRIWFHLMGRGLVDPIDDFRPTNPASHPALLDRLAQDLVEHHYDVRYVIRLIMNSSAFALSSTPNNTNGDDETNYSHVLPRRLTAEQLFDAQHQVAGVDAEFAGYPKGTRAMQISGVRAVRAREQRPTAGDQFLVTFGKPARLLVCECERSNETTLGQAFALISGPEVTKLLASDDNRLGRLMKQGRSDAEIVTDLYWSALTRPPTNEEVSSFVAYVQKSPDRRRALEDVAWAILNAKEFILRK